MPERIPDTEVESVIRMICDKANPANAVDAKLMADRWLLQVQDGIATMSPELQKKLEDTLAQRP
jgi:hypothetical protein